MDQIYQTSVHLVEDVDKQTLVGGVVVHQQTHVVYNQATMVETLE